MHKNIFAPLQLLVIALCVASCSSNAGTVKLPSFTSHKMDIRQGNLITPAMREKLKVGMSRAQVRNLLGTPLINDVLHNNRWDYIYRFEKNYQLVEKQHMILYFENDRLQRIDDSNMPALATAPLQPPSP